MWDLSAELTATKRAGLYRQTRPLAMTAGMLGERYGRKLQVFCSNDYLGLAHDPRLAAAMADAAREHGVGSGAAHLITGHRHLHEELETALAQFLGRERALVFSTGYMANLGTVGALIGPDDAVFQDALNHASLLDAGWLCRGSSTRYRHSDLEHLNALLNESTARRRLVITDGVFSMDGDIAPLPALADLAARHNAWLMVDDAHGIGVLDAGRGSVAAAGLDEHQVPVLMGTLGKAFGSFGAFIAGRDELIETLVQKARTYVFTTAMPPALAAASLASLKIIKTERWRFDHLHALITRFRQGAQQLDLPLLPSATPIQPLLIGDSKQALEISQALEQAGFLVTAIRPPTVPKGTARLRVTLSAAHSMTQVDALLGALETLASVWPMMKKSA